MTQFNGTHQRSTTREDRHLDDQREAARQRVNLLPRFVRAIISAGAVYHRQDVRAHRLNFRLQHAHLRH